MIRNLFEAVALIKAAPEKLKNFKELLDYARNIYKYLAFINVDII